MTAEQTPPAGLDAAATGHGRPAPSPASAGRPKPVPAADPKRPYHVGIAIGLTTGAYAASLLVTTRLQIETDHALLADRTPVEAAISALGDHHDWMDSRLEDARAQYAVGATDYQALQKRLAVIDKRLARLTTTVAAIERLGASIRQGLNLPAVPTGGHGTSGGSGGSSGGSSGGGSGSGSGSAAKPPPAPTPPPPPATGGNTGASGAP